MLKQFCNPGSKKRPAVKDVHGGLTRIPFWKDLCIHIRKSGGKSKVGTTNQVSPVKTHNCWKYMNSLDLLGMVSGDI